MEEKIIQESTATSEELETARHIVELEKAALDLWFNGQTSGYDNLWSRASFSYFDGASPVRIDSHEQIEEVLKTIEGKLYARNGYDFRSPRVQFFGDTAILTFQLFADTTLIDMRYNCIEVYHKEQNGEWHVVHSTWSFIRPMDMNFSNVKEIV